MIHFKLISICYTYTNTHTFFTNGYPILLALCWGDQSFPMGIFFFILSHWFMCILSPIPYCLDYWGFIVSCESGSVSSQMLFSLFRTVLPFSHPRSFAIPYKFSISLSFWPPSYTKVCTKLIQSPPGISLRDWIESIGQFGEKCHLCNTEFSIYEHGDPLQSLTPPLILSDVLSFSVHMSCCSFIIYSPQYFIHWLLI